MSNRNTVDFDDLLASLDDLTTTVPPAKQYDSDDDNKGGRRSRSSSSSSSSSSDDEHHHAPPPPVISAPPPAPKAKAVAAPPPAKPKAAKPAPASVSVSVKPKVSSPPVAPQSQHASVHHGGDHGGGGGHSQHSGDLRNHARQSTILTPATRGGSSDSCNKCGQRFDSEYVVALGKSFHLHHFTCHDCGSQLQGSFYEHHGNTLCQNCAGNLLPCSKCHRGITGQYIIQDNRPHHKECIERWTCAKCHRDVEDVVTTALGKRWHKHCFVCQKCNTQLGGQFVNDNGNPICNNCSHKGLPKCTTCGRELIGDFTNYDGRSYHNECFKCGKCGVKLQMSGFYNVGGQAVCERCAR